MHDYAGPAASTIHVFDGEGDYAGLTALLEVSLDGEVFTVRGRVFDGVLEWRR